MRRRWTANTWLLAILLGIMSLAAIDFGRRMVAGEPELPPPPKLDMTPGFKTGDPAPDFTLPDAAGKKQTLASLVDKDTLLFFTCGCETCRQVQSQTGAMIDRMGAQAPKVISVTTTHPATEEAYFRETKLKQKILYQDRSKPIPEVESYKGHPCPRAFRLDRSRKVVWIGQSPAELGPTAAPAIALEIAEVYGQDLALLRPAGVPGPGSSATTVPTGDATRGGAAMRAHGPGDGHKHGPGDGHNH